MRTLRIVMASVICISVLLGLSFLIAREFYEGALHDLLGLWSSRMSVAGMILLVFYIYLFRSVRRESVKH